jgi:hypothetical protein
MEVNIDKSKYMSMTQQESHNIRIHNELCQNATESSIWERQ